MKPYLRQTVFFIFLGVFILCSCNKESITKPGNTQVMPPPGLLIAPYPTDTTGGTIISNLSWSADWVDLDVDGYKVVVYPALYYISIDSMVRRPVQVFVQLNPSSDWIYVPVKDWAFHNAPTVPNNSYDWTFPFYPYGNSAYFTIYDYSLNDQREGQPVKVKVKIL